MANGEGKKENEMVKTKVQYKSMRLWRTAALQQDDFWEYFRDLEDRVICFATFVSENIVEVQNSWNARSDACLLTLS
ncbi:hypothetical protein SRHO_G00337140 [Serrasalmus rhombeus]